MCDQLNVSGGWRAWETYVKQAKTQAIIQNNSTSERQDFLHTLFGLSVTTQVGSGYHWQPVSVVFALLLFTCFIKKGAVCLFVLCWALIKIRGRSYQTEFSKTPPGFPWLPGCVHRHTESLMQELLSPSDYCHCNAYSAAPL